MWGRASRALSLTSWMVLSALGCGAPRSPLEPAHTTGNAPAPRPEVRRPTYSVVDATPPFWDFWEQAKHADPPAQVRLFKDIVVRAHPELYEPNVVAYPPVPPDWLDRRLTAFVTSLPARIDAMRTLSARVRSDLSRYDRTFRDAFPDMAWSGTVYFTLSLDAFDGGTRQIGGKEVLLFGIDKIAVLHGAQANLSALFHHEIFHVYQSQVRGGDPVSDAEGAGLLEPLWAEGLAVYVSKHLNPDASWKAMLFSDEVAMVRDGTARLADLAAELRRNLDTSTRATYRDFFLAGQRPEVPHRVAYFIGYLVAARVAKERSLAELARLHGQELRREVDRELAYFESGGKP